VNLDEAAMRRIVREEVAALLGVRADQHRHADTPSSQLAVLQTSVESLAQGLDHLRKMLHRPEHSRRGGYCMLEGVTASGQSKEVSVMFFEGGEPTGAVGGIDDPDPIVRARNPRTGSIYERSVDGVLVRVSIGDGTPDPGGLGSAT
jgi:hypothetical protein